MMLSATDLAKAIKKILAQATEISSSVGNVDYSQADYSKSAVALFYKDPSYPKQTTVKFFSQSHYSGFGDTPYNKSSDKTAIRKSVNAVMEEILQGQYDQLADFLMNQSLRYITGMYPSLAAVLHQFKQKKTNGGTLSVGVAPGQPFYTLRYSPRFLCSQMLVSMVYNMAMDRNFVVDSKSMLSSTVFTLMHETYHVTKAHISAKSGLNIEDDGMSPADYDLYNYVYDSQINTELVSILPDMHGAVTFDFIGQGNIFWVDIVPARIEDPSLELNHPFLQAAVPLIRQLLKNMNTSTGITGIWINFQEFFKSMSPKQVSGGMVLLRQILGGQAMIRDTADLNDYIDDAIKKVKSASGMTASQKAVEKFKASLPCYCIQKGTQNVHWVELSDADGDADSIRYYEDDMRSAKMKISAFITLMGVLPVNSGIRKGCVYLNRATKKPVMAEEDWVGKFGIDKNLTEIKINSFDYVKNKVNPVRVYEYGQLLIDPQDIVPGATVKSPLFNGTGIIKRIHEKGRSAIVAIPDSGTFRNIGFPYILLIDDRGGQHEAANFPLEVNSMVTRKTSAGKQAFWVRGKTEAGHAVLQKATKEEFLAYAEELRKKASEA